MSELGDKERRFVEDQRRVEVYRSNEAILSKELARQDALLAEAAEVLRARPLTDDERVIDWYEDRAKPLLDKLGERE